MIEFEIVGRDSIAIMGNMRDRGHGSYYFLSFNYKGLYLYNHIGGYVELNENGHLKIIGYDLDDNKVFGVDINAKHY
jgi:hypothetical protein